MGKNDIAKYQSTITIIAPRITIIIIINTKQRTKYTSFNKSEHRRIYQFKMKKNRFSYITGNKFTSSCLFRTLQRRKICLERNWIIKQAEKNNMILSE